MSNFEFVFSLLAILLGLALAAVLGGVARVLKARPRMRLGWATGLLATWVTTETVIFWQIIWQARNGLPSSASSLFAGFIITALYYFAAASVFPDDLTASVNLDDYFMGEKPKVIGALLAALLLSLALWLLFLGGRAWHILKWYDWLSVGTIYVAGPIALLTKRRRTAIACLALLVVVDLLDPLWTVFVSRTHS